MGSLGVHLQTLALDTPGWEIGSVGEATCLAFFATLGQRRPWQSLRAAKLGASATYVQLHESEDLDMFACNLNSLGHGQLPASFDLFVYSWLWFTFSDERSCN